MRMLGPGDKAGALLPGRLHRKGHGSLPRTERESGGKKLRDIVLRPRNTKRNDSMLGVPTCFAVACEIQVGTIFALASAMLGM